MESSALRQGIKALKDDHDNGASVLATQALNILNQILVEDASSARTGSELWHILSSSAYKLKLARPSMDAAIGGSLIEGLSAIKTLWQTTFPSWSSSSCSSSIIELKNLAASALSQTTDTRTRRKLEHSTHLVAWLRDKSTSLSSSSSTPRPLRIMTLSASSSIQNGLIVALNVKHLELDIRILESRPRFEGASLALNLARSLPSPAKSTITIASDASAALFASDIDILLLGADRISRGGDVSNKIGSLPAVLCTRSLAPHHACIAVMAESDKMVAAEESLDAHEGEENSGEEVSAAWGSSSPPSSSVWKEGEEGEEEEGKVRIRNVYFETVGREFIDSYIMEMGVLSRDDVRAVAEGKEGREREIFGAFME